MKVWEFDIEYLTYEPPWFYEKESTYYYEPNF